MDNVTHSLVGVLMGKAYSKKIKAAPRAALWTAILANNAPDLDFVVHWMAGKGEGAKLAYLLHHRGWTHVFVMAPFIAWVIAWIGSRLARTQITLSLWVLSLCSVLAHILMDSLNDYGVHPLSPFSQRWYYGDTLFIVEPALWFSILPLAMGNRLKSASFWLWGLLWLAMGVLVWMSPFVALSVALALTLWAGLIGFLQWSHPEQVRVAFFASLCVLAVFGWTGSRVKIELHQEIVKTMGPGEAQLDLSTTPAPGNPFCWKFIHSMRIQGDYVAELGVMSLMPRWFDPGNCHFRMNSGTDLPSTFLSRSLRSSTERIHWFYEFRGSFAELRSLQKKSPPFDSFLRFARFPFWREGGSELEFGDLRYSLGGGSGFANFTFSLREELPSLSPPWEGSMHALP